MSAEYWYRKYIKTYIDYMKLKESIEGKPNDLYKRPQDKLEYDLFAISKKAYPAKELRTYL